jgi:hypothetical protein
MEDLLSKCGIQEQELQQYKPNAIKFEQENNELKERVVKLEY